MSDREKLVSDICELFAEQLRKHKDPDFSAFVAQNPDLEPELSPRLETVLKIWQATGQVDHEASEFPVDDRATKSMNSSEHSSDEMGNDGEASKRFLREVARKIHCPHCGIGLQLVQPAVVETTCRVCGSSIQVDPVRTRTLPRIAQQKIGDFTLVSILGKGSFGTVYKARDDKMGRFVAIKVPRDGVLRTTKERQRFIGEARLAGKLKHDNIVKVHQIGDANGVPFIVSELIEGLTLADLSDSRQLEFRETAEVVALVCDAISEAHSNNVVHRDLKPSNILLDRELRPYVADFGLARMTEGELTITIDGEILGTLLYMSPEQASGSSNKVGKATDIYSLGVILYRLLSGSLPFRGSERMVLHQVKHDEPKSLRLVDDQIPRDLETITAKAMAKEPDKRFESASELAAELRRWLNGNPILTRPITRVERVVRWCRRRPAISGLSATVAILALVALAYAGKWAISNAKLAAERIANKVQLVRSLENEGEKHLQNNDVVRSLNWYIEAMQEDPNDDPRHRFRIGMILNQCPTLNQLTTIDAAIVSIDVSKDGKQIAVGDDQGAVTIFDADTGEQLQTYHEHQKDVLDVQFSSDGKNLVSSGVDHYAVLWNLETGLMVARLNHGAPVREANFSASRNRVLTTAWNGAAGIWNTIDGSKLKELTLVGRNFESSCISFSENLVAVASYRFMEQNSENWVSIWDVESGELKHDQLQSNQIRRILFNNVGSELLIETMAGEIDFIDSNSGEAVRPSIKSNGAFTHVSYSPDDRELLTISELGQLAIWNLTEKPEKRFTQVIGNGRIERCSLSNNRELLASMGAESSIHIDFANFQSPVCVNLPSEDSSTKIAFHPDGRRVITGSASGVVRIWDLASTVSGQTVLPHDGDVLHASLSQSGEQLVTCSMDGYGRIWSTNNGQRIGSPIQHEHAVFRAEFNSSGSMIASVSSDKTAKLWDTRTSSEIASFQHDSPVVRMAFHPAMDQFATGTFDGQITIWEKGNDRPIYQTAKQGAKIVSIAYHPDGNSLAAGSENGELTLIQKSGQNWKKTERTTHEGKIVNAIKFFPRGSGFVTGGYDWKVRLWDPDADLDERNETLNLLANVNRLDIRLDHWIAIADNSGAFSLWELVDSSWKNYWIEQIPGVRLQSIRFHPNQRFVGVSAESGLANPSLGSGFASIHDIESRTAVSPKLMHFEKVSELIFDPNGNFAVTYSDDDKAIIWDLTPTKFEIEHLRTRATLYTSHSFDNNGGLFRVSPAELEQLFQAEAAKFPDSFRCTDEQISKWEQWIAKAP